ncbi:ATP-binding cassette domain-containing protein [Mycolicibacterium thermoresistibile]|uniref:ABC transporter domain-containing protein n=2 Tax=Mycolicibacterium thermoresistibile TaxID=1797 RepID=G7CJL4_MYCT3|nr:ATP-binding cassette domain-containing protein [Mycolicibacterium thermoresistibile]EHI11534.1 hypothetical protein KEK_11583 [Mycolicibacterium thermoresistibile ATCC 19527]MCV7189038.1 hypothetical protein [Mycolicibacterium thermoresistibile]GAT14775.1 putative uncharacterized protein [Mycolicibacterium thermoresistibile]SNW20000.1 cytochrome c biogenesis protein CcmA [Mycolicibacterium thermoresistibile]
MPDQPEPEQAPEPALTARGICMRGPWGPVYGPIDLDIEAGGVTVLHCPPGSGRTALLMTLAGRMRPMSGELTVFGRTRAPDIFRVAGLAGFDEVDPIPQSVTVRDLVTEQVRWDAPWYRLIPRAGEAELAAVCGPVFGELPLPPLGEYVGELSELDRMLLRIALANTRRPALLVAGNLDDVAADHSRDQLVRRLIALGERQTVITATVNEVVGHDVRARIPVPNTSRAELAHRQKGDQ